MSVNLEILSIGMVTAVGLDAPSSCAAMRARLDGFRETKFRAPDGGWLIGAGVPLPRQWVGERRLAHLAAGAIVEAFENAPDARDKAAVILCLPEADRPGQLARESGRLFRQIAQIVEVEPHASSHVIAHGRPSGHVALRHARDIITRGEVPYVVIVGVDSYLTRATIHHFIAAERLLTSKNPNGFIPGEAAGAIILAQASSRGFQLFGLGFAREKAFIYNDADLPLRGDGMTEAYSAALAETGIEMNQLGYRIADLIGEQYWFKQSALASLRLVRGAHDFQDLWSPAESLGNVGAAVVPIMVGMAATAARRGYSAGNPVLVEASNDSGACAAALLGQRVA
jgi:3-oxoacyl-[acyl-carrier-protein] synthase-1